MRLPTVLFILSIFCFAVTDAPAQAPHAVDPQLQAAFHQLSAVSEAFFQVSVSKRLEGSKDVTAEKSQVYYSRLSFVQYAQSAKELFFMNKHGMFKVNVPDKRIFYRQFASDSVWQEADKMMSAVYTPALMDSIFLAGAIVKSKHQAGSVTTFHLTYDPKRSIVRDLDFAFDGKQGLPVHLKYSITQSYDGSGSAATSLTQVVDLDHYKHEPPAEVAAIVARSGDLKAYLQAAFPGYTIKTF